MMTFYLGKEYALYEKKFNEIIKHYKPEVKNATNSEIFRHIVDLLYSAIIKNNKKEGE